MTARSWRRRAVAAGAVIAIAAAAACSGSGSLTSVTGKVSGCAAVLPLANNIVHNEGTLTLVRRISRSEADTLSRKLGATPPVPPQPLGGSSGAHRPVQFGWPKACLVVYRGDYPQGTIDGASPPAVAGHYTLMVLRVRHPSADRILVTDRLPSSLRH
ncbi:MAG: hypothetical protein ACRDRI_07785 [Pseudonocardiaceae bacterium]